jgi:two-component sensor histidine kinase
VSVTPTAVDDTLLLEYRDDGPGYPTDVIAGERLSTGMSLARELVQGTLRGTLRLLNDGGAVARLNIPMEEPDRT